MFACAGKLPLRHFHDPGFAELRQHPGNRQTITIIKIKHQTFKVRTDLNIHRRADGRLDTFHLHHPAFEKACQNVIAVRPDHKLFDRKPHLHRGISGIDIAEIARRDREGNLAFRRSKLHPRPEIIGDLAHDARPVDRIDRRKTDLVAESMIIEQCLHQVLTIIKRSLDRDVMHIVRQDRRHLATLHFGNAPLRMQDENIDIFPVPAGFNRG